MERRTSLGSIGIIGFGNMGEAIASGLKRVESDLSVFIVEKDSRRAAAAVERFSAVNHIGSWPSFFGSVETIVLAVKPQDVDEILAEIAPHATPEHGFISVLAGRSISGFCERLSTKNICRLMPNLAAREGAAFVAMAFAEGADASFTGRAETVAEAIGRCAVIPERLFAAVTGLSGSGIAYVFSFLHALALGGTRSGIPYDTSLEIALSVLEGATAVLRRNPEHPISLLSKVASPAGTTIEGIDALESGGFTASVMEAVVRASKRAQDLER